MSTQAAIIMAGGVALVVSTARLVRLQLLSIRYGLGWMSLGLIAVFGAPVLALLSEQVESLGFTPTGFSLGIFILFLGLVCLQLSISLSGVHRAVQDLSEHGALLEQRVFELERERDE